MGVDNWPEAIVLIGLTAVPALAIAAIAIWGKRD